MSSAPAGPSGERPSAPPAPAQGPAQEPAVQPEAQTSEVAPIVHRGIVYRVVMAFCASVLRFRVGIRLAGLENLPPGAAVIAANHRSYIDIPMIAYAAASRGAGRRHVCFVARETLATSRMLGFIMRHAGVVLIARGRPDRAALRDVAAHLAAGDLVAIFPEGTRGTGPGLQPFQAGALHAARRAAVPVIPCAIGGSAEAWPRDRRFPIRHPVAILFGPAIDPDRPDALAAVRTWLRGALATMPEHPPLPPEPDPEQGSDGTPTADGAV